MPRPKLQPTAQDRQKVKSLAAVGTPQEDIARIIGIRSTKTLRKYFGKELAHAVAEANASVGGALYRAAMEGDVGAMKYWLSCRAKWRPSAETVAVSESPFVVKIESVPSHHGGSNAQA